MLGRALAPNDAHTEHNAGGEAPISGLDQLLV